MNKEKITTTLLLMVASVRTSWTCKILPILFRSFSILSYVSFDGKGGGGGSVDHYDNNNDADDDERGTKVEIYQNNKMIIQISCKFSLPASSVQDSDIAT